MADTDTITEKKAAMVDRLAAGIMETLIKMLPLLLAVVIGGMGTLYVRDQRSAVPENVHRAAEGLDQLLSDFRDFRKVTNAKLDGMSVQMGFVQQDLAALKASFEHVKRSVERLEDRQPPR